MALVHFLWLSSIPLCTCTTSALSIQISRDLWLETMKRQPGSSGVTWPNWELWYSGVSQLFFLQGPQWESDISQKSVQVQMHTLKKVIISYTTGWVIDCFQVDAERFQPCLPSGVKHCSGFFEEDLYHKNHSMSLSHTYPNYMIAPCSVEIVHELL